MGKDAYKMSYLYNERKKWDRYTEVAKYDSRIVGTREDQVAFHLASAISRNMKESFYSLAESIAKANSSDVRKIYVKQ